MNPKVFVSHASEDKERFVIKFAENLRSKGIDAWLDKWEMFPGDSIVDKIFEEGIKNANAFIVVVSHNSANKKWVKEEINASFVKKIEKSCKIIPIVLDNSEVPECLKSTVWENITNVNDYTDSLNRIVNSIFNIQEKPALGAPPKYVDTEINSLPGITSVDSIVFKLACDHSIDSGQPSVSIGTILDKLERLDISHDQVQESLEILHSRGYLKATRVMGGLIPHVFINPYGFDLYAKQYCEGYDNLFERVCCTIVNKGKANNHELAQEIGRPVRLISHIFDVLEMKNYVRQAKVMGGHAHIHYVSPELKRMVE